MIGRYTWTGILPILLTDPIALPPPQAPPRKRWTPAGCAPLEASGLFERERLELVCGELISKTGKNRPHVNAFREVQVWLHKTFGSDFVDVEAPLDVSPQEMSARKRCQPARDVSPQDNPTSEPDPDIIVLNRECRSFVSGNPQPKDISLVVEIADSSLELDRTLKAELYARAGILEYWVVDVANQRLIAHRDPLGGVYRWIAANSGDIRGLQSRCMASLNSGFPAPWACHCPALRPKANRSASASSARDNALSRTNSLTRAMRHGGGLQTELCFDCEAEI